MFTLHVTAALHNVRVCPFLQDLCVYFYSTCITWRMRGVNLCQPHAADVIAIRRISPSLTTAHIAFKSINTGRVETVLQLHCTQSHPSMLDSPLSAFISTVHGRI